MIVTLISSYTEFQWENKLRLSFYLYVFFFILLSAQAEIILDGQVQEYKLIPTPRARLSVDITVVRVFKFATL